jgi:hypothetical protein
MVSRNITKKLFKEHKNVLENRDVLSSGEESCAGEGRETAPFLKTVPKSEQFYGGSGRFLTRSKSGSDY